MLVVFLLSLPMGAVWLPPAEWWNRGSDKYWIFWELRFPRVVLGLLVGAGLGISGAALQGFFRNPLASEFTLGVSGATGFGAYLVSFWLPALPAGSPILSAWLCALVTLWLAYILSRINGKVHTVSLLLAGIVFNTLFASFILLHQYLFQFPETARALRWVIGGIQIVGYREIFWVLIFFIPAFLWLIKIAKEMNALSFGEAVAETMGLDVAKFQKMLYIAVSLLISAVVSQAGPVAFIGLMAPHIGRMLTGSDFRLLFPFSACVGGSLLIIADAFARTVLAPVEIPVGVFTGALGSIFFLYLLWKVRHP